MDTIGPIELNENENFPTPYITQDAFQRLDVQRFYQDLGLETENEDVLHMTCRRIENEIGNEAGKDKIEMGSTTQQNLEKCRNYLEKYGIQTGDPTIDINILRVFKNIPTLYAMHIEILYITTDKIKDILENDLSRLIIEPKNEYLRDRYTTTDGKKVTLDSLKAKHSAPANIQRHVTEKELGYIVLPYAMLLYRRILNSTHQELVERR